MHSIIEKFKLINKNVNKKNKLENLVVLIILLIIVVIVVNNIWNSKKEDEESKSKVLATSDTINENRNSNQNELESKLENCLSKIKGVGKVSVLISITETSQINPLYNEDKKESITEETDSVGGNRIISATESSKEIIYEEIDGEKTIIAKNEIMPKIEGAIIIAEGGENTEVKSKIINAVQAVTGIETYKIQVFEMNI